MVSIHYNLIGLLFVDLGERGWDGMDWIELDEDREWQWRALGNKVMNLRVP
jgi:hypothetical protein